MPQFHKTVIFYVPLGARITPPWIFNWFLVKNQRYVGLRRHFLSNMSPLRWSEPPTHQTRPTASRRQSHLHPQDYFLNGFSGETYIYTPTSKSHAPKGAFAGGGGDPLKCPGSTKPFFYVPLGARITTGNILKWFLVKNKGMLDYGDISSVI